MGLTKLEILEETKAYYETHDRAVDSEIGKCYYLKDNGDMCAFSRCTVDPEVVQNELGNDSVKAFPDKLDTYLKKEYGGYDIVFWISIQKFHDYDSNWDGRKLSESGVLQYEFLKQLFEKELVQEVVSV